MPGACAGSSLRNFFQEVGVFGLKGWRNYSGLRSLAHGGWEVEGGTDAVAFGRV